MVGTNYSFCSVGTKLKQDTNKHPPNPPKSSEKECKKVSQNILIQTGVVKAALLSLMHNQSPPYLKHKHSHIQIINNNYSHP